ncbi:uncharacterized protein [Primulina eburnea]|uniref:uncharacterized protein n=1 Tax=Primulina eburnea TaxID=1245227 RepID=UPI003C6BE58F
MWGRTGVRTGPARGNRGPGGGNQGHADGNRGPRGGNQGHADGNRGPGGGNQGHADGNRGPRGGNQAHADGNRGPGGGQGRGVADLSLDQLAQLINTSVNEALRRNRTPSPPPQQPPLPPPLPEHMEAIWEEVRRLGRRMGGRPPVLDRESPLSLEILNEDLPVNFRQPTVKDYDGSTDPEEHLGRFNNSALLHRYSDGVKCRVFLTTLVGPAQRWFDLLPPHSITSFREFSTLFINQYATSKKYLKTSLGLFNLKQGDTDSLRDFIRRFNSAALEVPAAATETLVNAFTQGLRGGQFFNSLVKKPPQSYDELLSRAEKYVNLEDAQRQRRVDIRPDDKNKGKEKVEPSRKRPAERTEERSRGPGPFPYAPLAMSLERAMAICEERRKLERPKQAEKGPRLPPSDKFCEFHQEYGHVTNDCQRLGEEVQRIMQRDPHMKNLLARSEGRYRDERRDRGPPGVNQRPQPRENRPNRGGRDDPPRHQGPQVQQIANDPTRGVIHMITGGATDGDSGRARKAHGRRLESLGLDLTPKDDPVIGFGPDDMKGVMAPHNDALLVTLTIANYDVARIFVDTGSSVNVLFKRTLDQMKVEGFEFDHISTPLFGFTGHAVQTVGQIMLPLSLGAGPHRITKMTCFTVVDAPSSYNGILGRPALAEFRAVSSTYHQKLKYPVGNEVGVVGGDQKSSRRCYVDEVRQEVKRSRTEVGMIVAQPNMTSRREVQLTSEEEPETVEIGVQRSVRVAADLDPETKHDLLACLKTNIDVFAWSPQELRGISPGIMKHHLNTLPEARPVKQKKRHFGPEKDKVIKEQVDELLKAGHIREIFFPTWLSNVVLVPKSSGKWRMCVDFRDLNKACPKDCYPLPRIDQLVDSTSGHQYLCLMDAYQGYHQIPLAREDQDKVSFITSEGTFCYVVMPFGLKNAGATYQRLMDKVFSNQIGRNVEVYVDDILVKSKNSADLIADLRETFATLRSYGLKLNPQKCTFGVKSGKFLGYMVTERGIEANPEKVKAIQSMSPPGNLQEVQKLAGRIAALSRFISRAAHRSLPFFRVLRKAKKFEWDEECAKAFEDLKTYLAELPILAKPSIGEQLYVYLSATEAAVSSVLVRQKGTEQNPVYYISHALKGAELRYTTVEKLALALITTARRLRPYFLSHPIMVLTNSPLGKIMTHADISGRLVKWTTELGEYDIQYGPRTAIKAQALADFLAETLHVEIEDLWKVYVDGSSTNEGSGVGVLLISPKGDELKLAVRLDFRASNNEAEYEAVLAGLRAARQVGAARVHIFSDSQLVAHQMNGSYDTKNERLIEYVKAVEAAKELFTELVFKQIPREENEGADSLAKIASSLHSWKSREVVVQVELNPSVHYPSPEHEDNDWRAELLDYMKDGVLPEDPKKAYRMKRRSLRFVMVNGTLYKRSAFRPLLKCLGPKQSNYPSSSHATAVNVMVSSNINQLP